MTAFTTLSDSLGRLPLEYLVLFVSARPSAIAPPFDLSAGRRGDDDAEDACDTSPRAQRTSRQPLWGRCSNTLDREGKTVTLSPTALSGSAGRTGQGLEMSFETLARDAEERLRRMGLGRLG
jgi:hypothetical protein